MTKVLVLAFLQRGLDSVEVPGASTCPWGYLVNDALVERCRLELARFVAAGYLIAGCEIPHYSPLSEGFGHTDPTLQALVEGSSRYRLVEPVCGDHGAIELLRQVEIALAHDLVDDDATQDCFVLFGVRTNSGLLNLVRQLRELRPEAKIVVVKSCCNDDLERVDWSAYDAIPGIELVESGEELLRGDTGE